MSDSIANREDAIPVIRAPAGVDETTPTTPQAERQYLQQSSTGRWRDSASKIKGKIESYSSSTGPSLQDRFFAGIMAQVIPEDDLGGATGSEAEDGTPKADKKSAEYVDRPNFSVGVMSSNFRRFNARVGILFVAQNEAIYLFTWRKPTATLAFLAFFTLLCLHPYLLPLVPPLGILFFIMTPSFLARHPAPANDPRVEPSYRGPPSAPPSRVKPAPEMSKDFFRNLRDLQNIMEDFSRMHDTAIEYVAPYTDFSDEGLSSMIFVALFGLSCLMLMGSIILPWNWMALVGGWSAILAGHPEIQEFIFSQPNMSLFQKKAAQLQDWMRAWIDTDIVLDGPTERRQVEIFELQKFHPDDDTWEPWLFSALPHDPMSPSRRSGARAKGTQFFEEVQPPMGWRWKDKKWSLDSHSREWVEQRMVTGVEIETEGERWVYDIPPDEIELLESPQKKKKLKTEKFKPVSGWEEATGLETRGEWRRRRWVRVVEKIPSPS